ncbi:hypothetical protein BKP37_17745 [Anaerobacillus alkalilacustris]|uniref:Uncharacterized protein n=1 Tax=Anaerobacillus alkalilacustris TaxID=393763 RepID=A0A1S2LD08_9BACI|nr:hypothetical protein [Anaerobacillus alkalilacustris]OIJ10389.1 hypothetical protein BKP37_17745 [Anaerobacillus alkalilacustris]
MSNSNIEHQVISLFNYSVILPDMTEETKEVLILGHLIIKNNGPDPLTTPFICIRTKPTEAATLGGKINFIKKSDLVIDATLSEEWTYVDKNWKEKVKETGEHWLRPVGKNQLLPNESLNFSNFDLRCIKPEEGSSVIIEAFIYFQEKKEGLASLNKIVINF